LFYQKNTKKPVKNYLNFFYKKSLSANFITAIRPVGANCGEWLPLLKVKGDKNTSLLDFIGYKRSSDKKEHNALWVE
jgi:hypothetical protein